MKMKFGAIVVDGSGKIGGHVASKNKAGNYLRTKVTPTNPNTVAQQNARALLSSLSTAWSALTDAERLSWNNAVSDYATTNIFGDIKNPSGFNLFIKLNANLSNAGFGTLNTAPPKQEIPYTNIVSAVFDISSTTGIVTYEGTAYNGVEQLVSATPPLSQGKTNVNSEFRGLGVFIPALGVVDIWDAYVAKFGTPPAGANISIRVEPVVGSGQKGTPQTAKVSVEA